MYKNIITILLLAAYTSAAFATFSICAVDPSNGWVGSAGASCISGSIILSDVHPGWGVVHTQAYYLAGNQNYARSLMNLHLSPQQIIDSVVLHDVQGNSTIRQYGVVDLFGGGRSAAFSGANCTNWKGHITGPTYSIQGNILLGQFIVDSMKARFLNTPGNLAYKLMAALQGAKVPGADTRCLPYNKSTISAFLRIARPQDTLGTYYINLNVNNTPTNKDPIDSLQTLFNLVMTGANNISSEVPESFVLYQNFPNPFNPSTTIKFDIRSKAFTTLRVFSIQGKEIENTINTELPPGTYYVTWDGIDVPSGIYFYSLESGWNKETKKMMLIK